LQCVHSDCSEVEGRTLISFRRPSSKGQPSAFVVSLGGSTVERWQCLSGTLYKPKGMDLMASVHTRQLQIIEELRRGGHPNGGGGSPISIRSDASSTHRGAVGAGLGSLLRWRPLRDVITSSGILDRIQLSTGNRKSGRRRIQHAERTYNASYSCASSRSPPNPPRFINPQHHGGLWADGILDTKLLPGELAECGPVVAVLAHSEIHAPAVDESSFRKFRAH
jgi:hypothetical protein